MSFLHFNMFQLRFSALLGLLASPSFAAASPDETDTTFDSLNKVSPALRDSPHFSASVLGCKT